MVQYPELQLEKLKIEHAMFKAQFTYTNVADAKAVFRTLAPEVRGLFHNVDVLLRLLSVCPLSSCEAERSFSALRRLKTWLRATMSQARLNALALSHVHQERLDKINLQDVAQDFVNGSQKRRGVFGTFPNA